MDLKISDIKPACIMHRLKPVNERSEYAEYIDIFFVVENYNGNIENREPQKHDILDFFDIDNLPENTVDYVKEGIRNALNGIYYCEYGFDDFLKSTN